MATNYNKPGRVIDWTNGTGASVASGSPVTYGIDRMGIATVTIANGANGSVELYEEYTLPKLAHADTGAVGVAGQPAYWLTDKVYDAPGLGRQYIGVFAAAAAAAAATCLVQLRPFREEGPRLLALTLSANLAVTAADLASGDLSLLLSNGAARTVTLPSVATIPRGAILKVRKTGGGAHALTLDPAGDETIAGNATHATIDADNDHAEFQSTGAAWLLVRSVIA
jgi:predicted RecA/RadA family phage recombinase